MRKRPFVPVSTLETRAPRIPLPDEAIRADVRSEDGRWAMHGWVRNLSPGGMYIESGQPIPHEAEVTVEMLARMGDQTVRMTLCGWVAHHDSRGMGIQLDPESIADPARIEALVAHFRALPQGAAAS
ncbi:MAG: PilZ domain-containing protein [Nitrospirota bacterium]|nr:PilZ domain-containing protein [Nitrospirota bacterium]